MILTDVYIPALDETCDFQLDETVPVSVITEEIAAILRKRSGGTADEKGYPPVLCSFEHGDILDGDETLESCGVKNGNRLMIV